MSKVFLISDLHLGHLNIIKYTSRPFNGVDEMWRAIRDNWNRVVGKYDKVYILGDLSFYGKQYTKWHVDQLAGIKYLVMGNHDRHKTVSWWLECGLTAVYDFPIIYDTKNMLTFSHEPIYNNIRGIHGHVHNTSTAANNVSVENINYTPIELSKLLEVLGWK